jgi:hypothetical protein
MRWTHALEIHEDTKRQWWLTWSDGYVYSGPFSTREAAESKLTELMSYDN